MVSNCLPTIDLYMNIKSEYRPILQEKDEIVVYFRAFWFDWYLYKKRRIKVYFVCPLKCLRVGVRA